MNHQKEKAPRKPYKNRLPPGTLSRKVIRGRVMITARTENGWIPASRYLWAQAYGPIPPDHIVTFRDGNPENLDLQNLALILKGRKPKDLQDKREYQRHYYHTVQKHRKAPKIASNQKKVSEPKKKAYTRNQQEVVRRMNGIKEIERQWQKQASENKKRQNKIVKSRKQDLSKQEAVRIDHKTIIYIRPDQNREEVIKRYKKAS